MYRQLFAPIILLIATIVTLTIEPIWSSYIRYMNQINDPRGSQIQENLRFSRMASHILPDGFAHPILHDVLLKVLVPWLLIMITYWGFGIVLLLVDKYRLPTSLYNTKYQKETTNNVTLRECIQQVIFNQVFVLLPGMYLLNRIRFLESFDSPDKIPNPLVIIIHLLIANLLGEIFYYISHRLLHTKLLYARIHKRHHNYKAPIAIVSLYAHPLEILFGNTLVLIGPLYLLGTHV